MATHWQLLQLPWVAATHLQLQKQPIGDQFHCTLQLTTTSYFFLIVAGVISGKRKRWRQAAERRCCPAAAPVALSTVPVLSRHATFPHPRRVRGTFARCPLRQRGRILCLQVRYMHNHNHIMFRLALKNKALLFVCLLCTG